MEELICEDNNNVKNEDASPVGSVVEKMRKTYRVETFIIPRKMYNFNNNNEIFRSTEELDLDNYHPEIKEEPDCAEEEIKLESLPDAVETVSTSLGDNFRPKSDLHNLKRNNDGGGVDPFLIFDRSLNLHGEELAPVNISIERCHSYDFLPYSKSGSDLKSIKESCEISYGSCEELCHHGNKNGCTVAAQSPSQVSEEIFKENWMQRLEFLRRRVSLIRDKEVALQERERLLLKKEKELRILERLVKEKIQRADLYLKRCTIRNSINLEDELTPNLFLCELSRPSPPPYPEKPNVIIEENNNPDTDSREILSAGSRTSNRSKGSSDNSIRSGSSRGEIKGSKQTKEIGNFRHLENQKNLTTRKTISKINSSSNNNPKSLEIARIVEGQNKDLRKSKWSAYSSWRYRSKPKMSYDDLDSTLSADIGDSSFAITSKKLDPRLVRKPRGFSRSASERGPKHRPCSLDLDVDLGPDGERVLRKISENISAVTERRETRFQDYGSIDIKRHKSEPKIDELIRREKMPVNSFENNKNKCRIDTANSVAGKLDPVKTRKERTPSFWNEEASDWLRKKRQAYNLATKRLANRDYENDKENFGNSKNPNEISEKQSRSKNEKGKKFTIFR